jgi:adenine-specific DNA-methyltransferase
MTKLKMHSPNLVDKNIEKIAEIFPNCITEVKGKDGEIVNAIDFELLQQELSDVIVEGSQERYRLDWPGKKESILVANSPIAKTLRPAREESVNFDTTENLFIEGDNLDALKLLQENYLGKVKMIYIDPPYNTGNDFIYEDDFAESTEEFFERSNQVSEEGERLIANPESNGRFHSDWLSMMYSRLKLARNLLSDDGVIFISIDDGEQANLRKICDEIFGERNYIGKFNWTRKKKGAFLNKKFRVMTENILFYQKQNFNAHFFGEKAYSDKKQPIVKRTNSLKTLKFRKDTVYTTLKDGKYDARKGTSPTEVSFINSFEVKNGKVITELITEARYVWTQDFLENEIEKGSEVHLSTQFGFNVLRSDQENKIKAPSDIIDIKVNVGTNEDASAEVAELFDTEVGTMFDYTKPTSLMEYLCNMVTYNIKDPIVLDFFAGSATTAHAIMKLNAEDGGKRKFIMVQLPEKTDKKSPAHVAGYPTIAELSKERIRRAGQKILEEHADKEGIENLDIGFRVLKVDSSNMTDVYYKPEEYKQEDLLDLADNIKADRSAEDLLFQVMLDWGLELSLPIETKQIDNKEVFYVLDNTLIACFDSLTDDLVNAIAQDAPLRFVSAEKFIQADHDKTNIIERFKQLSPNTEVKFI